MKIDYLTNLVRNISDMKKFKNSHCVDEENIKKAEEFLEERYFNNKVFDAMINAVGNLISDGERTNEDFEEYLYSLGHIHEATIRVEYPNIQHMGYFIRTIGKARCSYDAWVISNLALQMYYGVNTINMDGKTYEIDSEDIQKLKVLSDVISKAQSKEQIHNVMGLNEKYPELVNMNTRNILAGTNKNGTKMAINILKSYAERKYIPYTSLRLMANSEDEYIPLMQALEENVAVEGLQELQKDFSDLDLSFEEYYVKKPKEKASSHVDDKNKSMVKGNL